jgi:Kef-type K+ transport system membrane component KefB/mannitol/fructose-specific phosphotransferase system IIA component (Ntr-type)
MQHLSAHELSVVFVSLAALLAAARILGEIAQRLHLPGVVGEILAGILLGPTVFGALAPERYAVLFPSAGPVAVVLDGMSSLAIVLFLLVAGMEVDLSTVWRQGPMALRIGTVGMVFPFAVGFLVAMLFPDQLGRDPHANALIFSLFFATAVSISALPVIVKILLDLNLYRSDFGMVVVAASVLNDVVGWMVFATVLGLLGTKPAAGFGIGATIACTLGFAAFMLTVGRWVVHRALPWLQAYAHWPGGVLSFAMGIALLAAAFTEWIGVHAVFGSFLVGVAIGDSSHLRESTRATIDQFVSFIFAPLFFASIGLHVDFVANFDFLLVAVVLLTAATGKFLGSALGAMWGRMPAKEASAVGFAMSSVGAMGIIIGLLGLQFALITEQLFVALVVMALGTSILSGPLTQLALGRRKPRKLSDFFRSQNFVRHLSAATPDGAIRELAHIVSSSAGLDEVVVAAAVFEREEMLHTGVGNEVAVPHARLPALAEPIVAVGLSERGIDFDSPDGRPARIIFLVLTASQDQGAQTDILASIGRTFRHPEVAPRALNATNLTEFKAAIRSEPG